MNDRPVFVGGCPRSGTTMVRSMLNSHPDLAVPHETLFLVDGFRWRRHWGDLGDVENRKRLAEWVVKRKQSRWKRLHPDRKAVVEAMVGAEGTLGDVLAAPFKLYAEQHGKVRWGDKRPSFVLNLDALFAMYPDALYINVVRDPRAAVASINRVGQGRKGWYRDGVVAGTDLWERSQRHAGRWQRKLGARQFHEIVYEELVADPEGGLRKVIGFLGLDPSGLGEMLSFHEHADIEAKKMHPLVAQPVTTEAVRKWETELTDEEIAFVESVLAEPMRPYGYEPARGHVQVPADFAKRLRRRRSYMRTRFARRRAAEVFRNLTYRHPVAARR